MGRICILDYGSGNTRSVFNLFSSVAEDVVISNAAADIACASHIVLPGVGAFAAAMRKIRDTLPMEVLEEAVMGAKKPFLGICVGMQVMATQGREFGECDGLGWIPGRVEQMATDGLPLPHVGWNNVTSHGSTPLTDGLGDAPDFYFVHSFAFKPECAEHAIATTEYGERFCSVVRKENLFGVQFHPEKSQRTGIRLVKNFLALS
ncbi:imidazole glycerol phosphate synthase subunit HisH [Noviherbaspirillum saxi]|uniref:Imidazole glycerol phosphate synthase subunit HisH n=1 Tax=Noviherbaspirillum saxi TaxID=2320863 RepID=A0A3A3G8Z3_9BURK|nr:imidazole glycerol phosphate synthase subunit HisH [Noviherbaspirillum saxi]RJF98615.1 imidazole glycerol phosphate synthase subunit HisH [Noviherbaspirillum saxi]